MIKTYTEVVEKAVSKAQQRFMGMVHATQKGELKDPSAKVKKAADELDKDEVKDMAATSHVGLPEKVKKIKEMLKSYSDITEGGLPPWLAKDKDGKVVKKEDDSEKKDKDSEEDKDKVEESTEDLSEALNFSFIKK